MVLEPYTSDQRSVCASIATTIGIRSLLLRSKSQITASPSTGGSALGVVASVVFIPLCLHWQLML